MSTFKERLRNFDVNTMHFAEEDAKLCGRILAIIALLIASRAVRKHKKRGNRR